MLTDDCSELVKLGESADLIPPKPPEPIPWAEGDMPHAETLDLDEYSITLLKMTKCRSFRADFRHKLLIIIRAHKGYGRGGCIRAAKRLHVSRVGFWQWFNFHSIPKTRLAFDIIDNAYQEALEMLVAAHVKRHDFRQRPDKDKNAKYQAKSKLAWARIKAERAAKAAESCAG